MIRMSLDKETVLPPVSLSEEPQLAKTRPLRPKNGLHLPGNSQSPPTSARPALRLAKRRYSVGVGFKGLQKRRRRANSDSQSEPVLPNHFLLGGNIFDPLNLNSLLDEDVNKATNQETPKSSPLPLRGGDPVEILVPRDITDPLNLKGGGRAGGGEGLLLSPLKSRKRHRNRHHGGGGDREAPTPGRTVPAVASGGSVPASPLPCELNTAITCRDDVAPPPILPRRHSHPPPGDRLHGDGRQRRRRRAASVMSSGAAARPTRFQTPLVGGASDSRCGAAAGSAVPPTKKKKKRKDKHRYQHGNHSRYYGYRGLYGDGRGEGGPVGPGGDPRLRLLAADWFRDRKVLEVGCGAGHMTLAVARGFGPAHILGLDRDPRLVHAARQNIRHFLSHDLVLQHRGGGGGGPPLPLSFRVSRGPLAAPPLLPPPPSSSSGFPNNVTFIQGDYLSEGGRGQYDVIMCLGVTKWVHLQSGDAGVIRLFRRAYQSLSPGGLFILQPQPWSSYSHSKTASEVTRRHFRMLRLRPEEFSCFLTDSVGFSSYRLLTHSGNQRPVYLFHKGSAHRKSTCDPSL